MTRWRRRVHHWTVWSAAALTLACAPRIATGFRLTQPLEEASSIRPVPWHVGEHLVYQVRLGMLPAGTQSFAIVGETMEDGAYVYQFHSKAAPSSLLSKIYRFADERTSTVRKDDLLPVRYMKDVEDGSYRARYVVEFDRRHDQATVWENGTLQREWDVPPHVQDELSMIYFLRSKRLGVGNTYRYSMFTGRELVPVEVRVLSRVYYEAPAPLGKVAVFRLQASNGLVVWITDDEFRIPVRIEAPVNVFGTLVATLKVSNGLDPNDSPPAE